MHPLEKEGRSLMCWYTHQLHRCAMVDEGTQCMLRNKVRKHIARILRCVGGPGTCNVLMAEALSFLHILQKGLMVAQAGLLFGQREFSSHKDLVRSTRKMHSVP